MKILSGDFSDSRVDMMSAAVKSMDTRDRPSRMTSSESGVGPPSYGGTSGSLVVGGQSRVTYSCPPVHGGGSPLIGGGTTYAVARTTLLTDGSGRDVPPRRPSDVDCAPVKLGKVGGGLQSADGCDAWNPRASMAFDSAKGLLNPVGENNCFLNSAVQVCRTSS